MIEIFVSIESGVSYKPAVHFLRPEQRKCIPPLRRNCVVGTHITESKPTLDGASRLRGQDPNFSHVSSCKAGRLLDLNTLLRTRPPPNTSTGGMQQLMVSIYDLIFSFLFRGRTCRYTTDAGSLREANLLPSDHCQPENAEAAIECRARPRLGSTSLCSLHEC